MACLNKSDFGKPRCFLSERYSLGDDYVVLRELTANEFNSLRTDHAGQDTNNLAFVFAMLAVTVIDDSGNPVFATADEVKGSGLPMSVVLGMSERVLALSKLTGPEPKN